MFLHTIIAATLVVATTADRITFDSGSDSTRIPGAKGAVIVEQTVKVIKTSCIFDDDKLFMRRLAYVESFDGVDPDANSTGYHGGIWQVDENMFNKLKEPESQRVLSKYTNQFKDAFNKDWGSTTWEDCRKPLFSGLAARLYIELQIDPKGLSFPRDIPDQGDFWTEYYHGTDAKVFETAAEKLDKGCSVSGMDLVFVLDSSGSVGSSNFNSMKTFAKEVVESFDIGVNDTQIGFVSYDSNVYKNFYLNTYKTKSQVIAAINNVRYEGGGTNSHKALDVLYQTMFTPDKGARDVLKGFRRVGVFLTDGHSNSPSSTIASAKKVHKADITMFSVGVGSNVGMTELQAIASTPECLYLILLRGFDEVESLKYAIEEGACEAPIIMGPGTNGTKVDGTIPSESEDGQNCKVRLKDAGATIQIEAKSGAVKFFVSTNTYPSEAYYDAMIRAVPGVPGVIFLQKPPTSKDEGIVYCNIKGDAPVDSEVDVGIIPGDKDHCKGIECKNGGSCVDDLQSSYTCSCAPGFEGAHCEIDIDECLSSPCTAQGTCQDMVNGFVCDCVPGYTGTLCNEVELFDCTSKNPCNAKSRAAHKYYFAHVNPHKFVQCDNFDGCFPMDCPPGLKWNHPVETCTR